MTPLRKTDTHTKPSQTGQENQPRRISEEDRALRPLQLTNFIGQDDLKEKLHVAIQAAKQRGEPLDHVLFSGPPGLGKTSLASIIAIEMGSSLHSTSAPAISRPKDLARLLTLLEQGDILFIDEIHRLSSTCEEILYPAMEDESIDFIVGEGMAAQSIKLRLKPFTLIGATTRSGMLSSPLKARFGMEFKVEFYDLASLEAIVLRSAGLLSMQMDAKTAREIAIRARMTPRIANRLVRRLRDYALVSRQDRLSTKFVQECLVKLGVDSLGLIGTDRKILSLLIERYDGGPVGLNTIAALVDEEPRTIEEDCEPFLLRIGLLEKTPKGRVVTDKAYKHLGHVTVNKDDKQTWTSGPEKTPEVSLPFPS